MVGEKRFKKFAWIGLSVFILITAFLGYHLKDIRFDYDFENFFPSHDEETTFFFDYRDDFQSDNDFLLISIENEKGIFKSDFLKRVDDFSRGLENIEHVDYVRSITSEKEQFIFPNGSRACRFGLGCVKDRSRNICRHRVEAKRLHGVGRAALGQRADGRGVPKQFGQRHVGRQNGRIVLRVDAMNFAATTA